MIYRALLLPFLMLLTSLIPLPACARNGSATVGFEQERMPDGTEVGIWYPATGKPEPERLGPYGQEVVLHAMPTGTHHPLVVMSHGNGGSFAGHLDTGQALARAGFVVAALTHPGDNWRDQSRATAVELRPAALSALITYMLDTWSFRRTLDPDRVGAFGFSAGGFTVLAAAGGQPDLSITAEHCAAHPGFFDCGLLRSHPHDAAVWPHVMDTRIRAIVVAAPALGFAFGRSGLGPVAIPVQLWRADDDRILPAPFYADAVRAALPHPPEFHGVPGAGHFDFLAPCLASEPRLPICSSAPGFDRAAFHERFNAEIVRFFNRQL